MTFTPQRPGDRKFDAKIVSGIRFIVTDRNIYDPTLAGTAAIIEARSLADSNWAWRPGHFDRLAGTTQLREQIEVGAQLDDVTSVWSDQLAAFMQLRASYLIY